MIRAMILLGLATLGQVDDSVPMARVEVGDHVESFTEGFHLYESRGWTRYEGRPPLKVLQIRPEQFLVEIRTSGGAVRQGWIPSKDVSLSKRLPELRVAGSGIWLVPVFEFPVPAGSIVGSAIERTTPVHPSDRVIARHRRLPLCFSPNGRYVAFVSERREASDGIELVDLDSGGTRLNIPSTTAWPGVAFNHDGSVLAVWNPSATEPTIEVYQTRDARRIGSIRSRSQFTDFVTYSHHSIAILSGILTNYELPVNPVRFADHHVIAALRLVLAGLREARWDIRSGQLLEDRTLAELPRRFTSGLGRPDPQEIENGRQIHRIELLDVAEEQGDEIYRRALELLDHPDIDYVGTIGGTMLTIQGEDQQGILPESNGGRSWRSVGSALSICMRNRLLRTAVDQLARRLDKEFPARDPFEAKFPILLKAIDLSTGRARWTKPIAYFNMQIDQVPQVLYSNTSLALVSRDLCKIYDPADGRLRSAIWLKQRDILSRRVSLSPAGGFLLVVSDKPAATRVYDASTGEEITGFFGRHVQFSPDDRWVATWFPSDDIRSFSAVIPGAKARTIRYEPTPERLRIWRLQRAQPADQEKRG